MTTLEGKVASSPGRAAASELPVKWGILSREDAVGQARALDALYRSAASGTAVSL
jgi:hypothetical protein